MNIKITKIFLALVFPASPIYGAEGLEFIGLINKIWRDKNYSRIFTESEPEAMKLPSLPESHVALPGYHLFVSGDRNMAIQSLDDLIESMAENTVESRQAVIVFRAEFISLQSVHMRSLSPEKLESLHQISPEIFPINSLLHLVSESR